MKKIILQITLIYFFGFFSLNAQVLEVSSHLKISATSGGFNGVLGNDDFFGGGLTDAGDINQDGNPDLIVGARHDNENGFNRGAVWVLFMDDSQQVIGQQKINETNGNFSGNLSNDGVFGTDIANLGDLDGNGVNDFAVGASSSSSQGFRQGEVWILFMNSDGTVSDNLKISSNPTNFPGNEIMDNSRFGKSIAALGDLDNDGITEIAVTGYLDSEVIPNQGAVWILFLNSEGKVKRHQKINAANGSFEGDLANSNGFGYGVARLNDMDGDNIPEIAVGCRGDMDGGDFTGAVWILFLDENGMVKTEQKISAWTGNFFGDLDPGDQFGCSVSNMGDLDNNGIDDLIVGSWRDDDGGLDKGAFWVLLLNSDGTVADFDKISNTEGNFTANLEQDDFFSFALEAVDDLNGDGIKEILVGAKGDDDGGGFDKGAFYIIYPQTLITNTELVTDLNLKVNLFPNPTKGQINITMAGDYQGIVTGILYDMFGKVVRNHTWQKSGETFTTLMNTGYLPAANYSLLLQFGDKEINRKIIIVK